MFSSVRKSLVFLVLVSFKVQDVSGLKVSTAPSEETLEGQKAVLRCIYSEENLSDTLFVILWQKLDAQTGTATTVFNSQNPHDEKHYSGRLKQVGVASLQLSPVHKSDSGKYRCQVTPLPSFEQGEAETELIVTYPPEFPLASNTSLYVNTYDDLELSCKATGLPEQIHYYWYFQAPVSDDSYVTEKFINIDDDPRLWYVNGKSLHISDFSKSFEGTFRCEATNNVGSSSLYFNLYLKRPATFVKFPKEPVVVIEGEDALVSVTAVAVPNNITFKWFYMGQEIDLFGWSNVFGFESTKVYPFLRITQVSDEVSQLEIKDVTRSVAGIFTSTIFNNVGQPVSINITLDVQYPPSLTLVPAPAYTAVEGSALTLPCGGFGNPAPRFQWETSRGAKVSFEQEDQEQFMVLPNGNLTVFPLFRNDSGRFLCTVSNGIGAVQEAATDVTVLYPPTIIAQPSVSYTLDVGENLTMVCNTTGLPAPKYTWYKDHIQIDADFELSAVVGSSSLTVDRLSRQHRGVYRCQAENRFGMVFAESHVHIRYPPTITILSSVRRVLVGDDVNITCVVSGYPLPRMEWSHSSRSSDVRIASVVRNGTRGRLYISTVRLDDTTLESKLMLTRVGLRDCGLYYCGVENVVGSDKGFTELRCMDLPPVPTNVAISHVTKSGFVVAWKLENHIPNGEQFLAEVSLSGDDAPPVTVSCETTSCRVTSLKADAVYSVQVFGVNSAGRSEKSDVVSVKTKEKLQIVTTSTSPATPEESTSATPRNESITNPAPTTTPAVTNSPTTIAFSPTKPSKRTFGLQDIVYNSTDGWVRWRLESSFEDELLSWNSSSLQRCVKVEARSANQTRWRVVAWCVAAWTEACSLNLPTSVEWQVQVNLCWSINVGCGIPVPARTVAFKAREETKTVPTEAETQEFPIAAVVSATLALLVVVGAYVITYRHFRKRRRKMVFRRFDEESPDWADKGADLFGYDNRALVHNEAEDHFIEMTVDDGLRECHVVKKQDEEFEFFLKVDDKRKGQVITNLTHGGPAHRAGVRDGDRLVKINGENVESKSHDEIVNIIRLCIPKHEIKFILIDEEHDKPKGGGSPKVNGNAHKGEVDLRPRICKITKKRGTFGFHLQAQGNNKPGHFIKEVADGGPAELSGLRVHDRIIEVGGTNVEKMSHEKVVNAIKKSGNTTVLLVADEGTYKHFAARKKKIKKKHAYSTSESVASHSRSTSGASNSKSSQSIKSVAMSTATNKDEVARIIHVVKGKSSGYGFFLRVKKGQPGEYAGDLVENQASALCGLCEDDRVIAVNGDVVIDVDHGEVVKLVKSIPYHVVLVVVGPNAEKKAKTDGLATVLLGAKEHLMEKPTKIDLDKKNNSYGFFLKMDKGSPMHIVADVETDGAAADAGLKNGQIVAMVGEHNVMHATHEECVGRIKEAGNSVSLVVAPRATMELFYKIGVEPNQEFLKSWPSDSCFLMPSFVGVALEKLKEAVVEKAAEKAAEEAVLEAVKEAVEEVQEDRKLRICKLTKTSGGFGFFLRDDDGHYLSRVEAGGPAAESGAKENDEIIEINGVNVQKETHDEVVKRIKESGDTVKFAVLDEEDKKFLKAKGLIVLAGALVAESEAKDEVRPLPRLCVLEKGPGGYGFHLNGEGGDRPGQYLRRLQADGVAEKAGVKEGDRLIEINGTNISGKNHDELVQMIRSSGTQVTFLVVDEQADLYYKNKGIQIIAALAVADAIADVKDAFETKSTSSSLVEAEATVHDQPDDKQEDDDSPHLTFPPPPANEEEKETREELAEEIREEIREEAIENAKEEMIEEAKEELREEAAEDLHDAIAEAVVEAAKEEALDEIQDEVREEILDAAAEEIQESVEEAIEDKIQDSVEERIEDAIEDAVQERIEDAVEEKIEDAVEDRIEDAVEDRVEDVVEDRIEDAVEDRIEDAVAEAIEDAVEEKIEDAIEERIEDAVEERIEDAIEQRIEDAVQERIEDAIEEKIEEAAEEQIKEAVLEEIVEQQDENLIPLRAVAGAAAAAALHRGKENSKREEPKTPPATPVETLPAKVNVNRVVSSNRSVNNQPNRFVNNQSQGGARADLPKVRTGSSSGKISGLAAMFESGGNQPAQKPSWAKKAEPAPAVVEEKKPIANGQPNKPKQFNFMGGANMFKIVESSPGFN